MGVHFTLFNVFVVAAPIVAGVLSTRIGTAGAAFDFGAFMLALCLRAYWVFDRLAPRAALAESFNGLMSPVGAFETSRSKRKAVSQNLLILVERLRSWDWQR